MTTYAAMRSTFIELLNRKDCNDPNAALVKSWFDLSQKRIEREVRADCMLTVTTVDTTASVTTIPVPADWLQTKAIVWSDSTQGGEIDPVDLGTYYLHINTKPGVPIHYTREGDNWLVNDAIPAGATAKVIYYAKLTPLVDDSDEPTLASIAPDLIIYGALLYAATHFIDDRGAGWKGEWEFFREQVQSQSTEGENRGAIAVQPFAEFDDGV
jgi:hypothetical protein